MTAPFPLVFDGHNDTLQIHFLPHKQGRDFLQESTTGHLDLPRARRGGFGGGLFATFVPSDAPFAPVDPETARRVSECGFQALRDLVDRSQGQMALVRDMASLRTAFQGDVLAAVMHLEGAEAIDPELIRLETYYHLGLRSLGPVWSRPNIFGTGVAFGTGTSPDQGPGLTGAGKALVQACNQLGILIDLSHLNAKGFWDVARLSTAPLVATHSCVHRLSPSPRNLTDAQLEAIAGSGGMVGLNFSVGFLRPDTRNDPDTPITVLVQHIQALVDQIGVDHVGLGSDFDGCTIPLELHDVTGLPRLMQALRDSGFDEESLRKIAHGNWMRVLEATW